MFNNSRNFDPELYMKALSANSGSSNTIPCSSALQDLQDYSNTVSSIQAPISNDWNVSYPHASRNILHNVDVSSETFSADIVRAENFLRQRQENEIPIKFAVDSNPNKKLTDLNLNSIDEEDAFLYGDSSSLPEEPKSVKPVFLETNVQSTNSGWSDEEEVVCESPKSFYSHLKSNSSKSPSIWDLRKENKEATKACKSKTVEDEQSSIVNKMIAVDKLQKILSPAQTSVGKPFCDFEKNMTLNSQPSETKSKYHVAAQILKKKNYEKSSSLSKISDSSDMSLNINKSQGTNLEPEITRHAALIEESKRNTIKDSRKALQSEKVELKSSSKVSVSSKDRRYAPKALNQRNLDSIRDYLKGSTRKRNHSQAEYPQESKHATQSFRDISPVFPPNESPRTQSPDSNRRSPHRSRYKSPISKVRCHSPSYSSRNRSPVSMYEKHRSFENSPRNYSYDRYSRHSRSPIRKSQDRSPEYYRYRNKSPRSSRSPRRSRSPSYHRYKDKRREHKRDSYRAKSTSCKHHARSPERHHHRKGKERDSSDDSFFSLSLSRSVSPRSDSDENLTGIEKSKSKSKSSKRYKEEEKSKYDSKVIQSIEEVKSQDQSSGVIPSKLEEASQNVAEKLHTEDKQSRSEKDLNTYRDDVLKNLNPEDEKYLNFIKIVQENPDVFQDMFIDTSNQQLFPCNSTATYTDPASSFTNITNTYNTLTVPVQEQTHMSNSEPYMYNSSVLPVTIPFPPPPVDNFAPMMSPAVFPPPPVVPPPAISPVDYNPYVNSSILPLDPRTVEQKQQAKVRPPATLRAIPVSDDVTAAENKSGQQISVRCSQSLSTDQKSKLMGKVTPQTNLIEVATNPGESSNDNSSALLLAKLQKIKAKKYFAHVKVNSAAQGIQQMFKKMEEVWGKTKDKLDPSDKFFYSKCKNIISSCSDGMRYYTKEAKQYDDELQDFKSKLPKKLKRMLSEQKNEDFIREPEVHSVIYEGIDAGKPHICYTCNKQFKTIQNILLHLHTSAHKERVDPAENTWVEHFGKQFKPEGQTKGEPKKVIQIPVKGLEFIKPLTGFFCTLCEETFPDTKIAESHLLGHDHTAKYKNYIKDNPLYEKMCLFNTYINYSASTQEKRKRDEGKKEQQAIKRKKIEETDEKVKEMLNEEKNKEMKFEELEEVNLEVSRSKNEKPSNIKLNLSSEREKECEKSISGNKQIKVAGKVVYIGKAPNFKNRTKPWYKREMYAGKNEESDDATLDTDALKISVSKNKDVVSKSNLLSSKNQSDSSENATFSNTDTSKSNNKSQQKMSSEKGTVLVSINKEESNTSTKSNSLIKSPKKAKGSKSSCYGSSALESKEQQKQYKDSKSVSKEISLSEMKDPIVNQAIKNILYGSESSLHQKDIPVSEIKLPDNQNYSPKCKSGESKQCKPVPMDISPLSSGKISVFDANRKTYTEEENDFIILGINKDDFRPLAVPVPPPASVLGYYNVPNNAKIDTTVPPPNAVDTSVPPPILTTTKIDTSVPPPVLPVNKIDVSVPPPPVHPLNTIDVSMPPPIAINTTVPPPAFPLKVNQSGNFQLPSHTGFSSPANFPRPVVGKKINLSSLPRRVSCDKSNLITIKTSKKAHVSDVSVRNVGSSNVKTGGNSSNGESKVLTDEVKEVGEKPTVKLPMNSSKEICVSKSSVNTKSVSKSIEKEMLKCEQDMPDKNIVLTIEKSEVTFISEGHNEKNAAPADEKSEIANKSEESDIDSCKHDINGLAEDECEKSDIDLIVDKTTNSGSENIISESGDQTTEDINMLEIDKHGPMEVKPLTVTNKELETADEKADDNSDMPKTENTNCTVDAVALDVCLNDPNLQNQETCDNEEHKVNDTTLGDKTLICEQNVNNKVGDIEVVSSENSNSSVKNVVSQASLDESGLQNQETSDDQECNANNKALICAQNVLTNNKTGDTEVESTALDGMGKHEHKNYIIDSSAGLAECTNHTNHIFCEKDDMGELQCEGSSNDQFLNLDNETQYKMEQDLKTCNESQILCEKDVELQSKSFSNDPFLNSGNETQYKAEEDLDTCNEDQSMPFTLEKTEVSSSDQITDASSETNKETSMSKDCAECIDPPVSDQYPKDIASELSQKSEQLCYNSNKVLNNELGVSYLERKSDTSDSNVNNDLSLNTTKEAEFKMEDNSKNCSEDQSLSIIMTEVTDETVRDKFTDTNLRADEEASITKDNVCVNSPVSEMSPEEFSNSLQKADQSVNNINSAILNSELEMPNVAIRSDKNDLLSEDIGFLNTAAVSKTQKAKKETNLYKDCAECIDLPVFKMEEESKNCSAVQSLSFEMKKTQESMREKSMDTQESSNSKSSEELVNTSMEVKLESEDEHEISVVNIKPNSKETESYDAVTLSEIDKKSKSSEFEDVNPEELDTNIKPGMQELEDNKGISKLNKKPVSQGNSKSVDKKGISKMKKPVSQETEVSKDKSKIGRKLRSRGTESTQPDTSSKPEPKGSVPDKPLRRSSRIRKPAVQLKASAKDKKTQEKLKGIESKGGEVKSAEIVSETPEEFENAVFLEIDDSDTDEYENERK